MVTPGIERQAQHLQPLREPPGEIPELPQRDAEHQSVERVRACRKLRRGLKIAQIVRQNREVLLVTDGEKLRRCLLCERQEHM